MHLYFQPDGEIDDTYFGPDCFHPSRKGHHGFAYMLWNVMVGIFIHVAEPKTSYILTLLFYLITPLILYNTFIDLTHITQYMICI